MNKSTDGWELVHQRGKYQNLCICQYHLEFSAVSDHLVLVRNCCAAMLVYVLVWLSHTLENPYFLCDEF